MQLTATSTDYYKPSSELLAAINTALFLKRPLLLSGDPGTGKTECADYIARQLHGAAPDVFKRSAALRFNTKSISQATDLFYQYDAVAHFGDKENMPKESFINFNCLGVALLGTHNTEQAYTVFGNYKNEVAESFNNCGSVVLIDEIDKAPRDFPNDLLAELEKPPFKFRIKELSNFEIVQHTDKPVVVIITSNNEKGLPDAFLRRCVFHHINFPGTDLLVNIVKAKLKEDNPYFETAVNRFTAIRNQRNITKQPSTSELIDWITCLKEKDLLNGNLEHFSKADTVFKSKLTETLGIIAKTKSDYENVKKEIEGN